MSLLGYGFAALTVIIVGSAAAAVFVYYDVSKDLPDYEVLEKYEPPVMTRIHAHDGSLIAEYAHERRIFVPINAIPKRVIAAFLSAEDRRFFEHDGIDYQGVIRALIKAAETKLRGSDRRTEGASTITQQVAKNFLLSNERSLSRKLKEAILARRIESAYSKTRILELYLNQIYLGAGAHGVAAAGLIYFNKELKDLGIEEAAYLAALPKAPNNYHPFRQKEKATERRNWIIGQMQENGYITAEEAGAAKKKPLAVNFQSAGAHVFAAEFFAEAVRRQLLDQYGEQKLYEGGLSVRSTLDPDLQKTARKALMAGLVKFDREHGDGWRGPVTRIDIAGDWGKALSTVESPSDLDPWRLGVVLKSEKDKAVVGIEPPRRQDDSLAPEREAVELTLAEVKWARIPKRGEPKQVSDVLTPGDVVYVSPKDPENLKGAWSLMQIPEISGALVAMDPHTGRILAIAGGFSFDQSQFDRALQAKRQPGSAFKPFVYMAALDNGYKPTSIVLDAPIAIDAGPGQDIWTPENYEKDKPSEGPTTLRQGVERSRNQMTVRLAQDMGMPLITEYARRFGIYDDLLPVLSMSLGAGETTLLRLTSGYCMIANGGKKVTATLIDRIQDRRGVTVWRHDNRDCKGCKVASWGKGQGEPDIPDDRPQIVDPHTAYQMTSILEGVIQRGTAQAIMKYTDKPLAGKTGTTNDEKDAWFIGYSPDLVVGVFVGYDTPRHLGKGQTGGQVAAPIFGDFMKTALADRPATPFRIPPGIQLVRVNLKTGLRASPGDPESIVEAFKPDEEPDDAYSVVGFSSVGGQPTDGEAGGAPQGGYEGRRPGWSSGSGPGGLW